MAPGGGGGGGGGIIFVSCLVAVCFAQGPEIVCGPKNTTVFENQSAVFQCETRGGAIGWKINEILFEQLSSSDIVKQAGNGTAEDTKMEILKIRARAMYNGTKVQCLCVVLGQSAMSENATLNIMGPLLAVIDLKVTAETASSVTISWSPPFSLIPDIWYSVLIYNVTDENNLTQSRKFTNATSYTFAPAGFTTCQKYLFSVSPHNKAGKGERSPNITADAKPVCDLSTVIHPSSTVKHPEATVQTGDGALSPKDTKLPTELAVGLVVPSVVGFTVIGIIILIFIVRWKRKRRFTRVDQNELGAIQPAAYHKYKDEESPGDAVSTSTTTKSPGVPQPSQQNKKASHGNDDERRLLSSSTANTSSACDMRNEKGPEEENPTLALSTFQKLPTVQSVTTNTGKGVQETQEEESASIVPYHIKNAGRPILPEDSKVVYQEIDIRATHKMARSELGHLPTSGSNPLEIDDKTEGPYIEPNATPCVTNDTARGLPAVESIMSLLKGVAGRWKEIAEGLGFDEDHTEDEIFTNNSTDEACLQDCVEQWIAKLQPSWEKLSHVLRDMGEEELARKAWSGKDHTPDVGGGAAKFEVTPQEPSAQPQDGGTVTVASELSAPLSSDREVEETRGSKITIMCGDTPSVRPVVMFSGNGEYDMESGDCCVTIEEGNLDLSACSESVQEQCEKQDIGVLALGDKDCNLMPLQSRGVCLEQPLPPLGAGRSSALDDITVEMGELHSEKPAFAVETQAVECDESTTQSPTLSDGEPQKPVSAQEQELIRDKATVRKSSEKKKKRRWRRRRSLSPTSKPREEHDHSGSQRPKANRWSGDMPVG